MLSECSLKCYNTWFKFIPFPSSSCVFLGRFRNHETILEHISSGALQLPVTFTVRLICVWFFHECFEIPCNIYTKYNKTVVLYVISDQHNLTSTVTRKNTEWEISTAYFSKQLCPIGCVKLCTTYWSIHRIKVLVWKRKILPVYCVFFFLIVGVLYKKTSGVSNKLKRLFMLWNEQHTFECRRVVIVVNGSDHVLPKVGIHLISSLLTGIYS